MEVTITVALFTYLSGMLLGYRLGNHVGYKLGESNANKIERKKLINMLRMASERGTEKERNKIEAQSKRINLN